MTLAFAFLNALVATALAGMVARLVLSFLFAHPSARFGAFCIALGFAVGRYSYAGPVNQEALSAGSAAIGSLIALLGLWLWLVRHSTGEEHRQGE